MKESCLQLKIGSCEGCNVLEIAETKIRQEGSESRESILARLSKDMCPDGAEVRIPQDRIKSSVW